jgi:hypothetical protein
MTCITSTTSRSSPSRRWGRLESGEVTIDASSNVAMSGLDMSSSGDRTHESNAGSIQTL